MKLFVQARKDGYNVLYPKPTPTEFFQFAGDIRPDSKDPNLLGKFIYTISFANGGCIFTKHVIIQDVQRQGLGNIGFSIFISNIKKLSGNDVIKLLDELLNTYCKNYCPDYYLENKTEDWAIFEAIKNQYKLYDLSNDDTENYQRGTADAAFVYYIDKTELCKFFDNPYQEEYSKYKQVFFVEKNLEGKSDNPLNAIPHDPSANLTGKIDLENPKYKLIYNQQARGGVKIEVKVNGSLRYSKSKIKRKEDLQIIWSKQFCETKVKSGKCYEIGSDFLEINDIEKTITVKEIEIQPITYTLLIQTKDRFSTPITDAAITLKIGNYSPGRNAINNTIKITEEELQNKCYIIAQKDNLISPQREIKLEDTKGSISLILSEHKKVSFYVKDENGLVNNYNIQISNKEVQPKDGDVVFIGDEIEKTWQISVSHRDYETERFNYCPANDDNPKYVILKKKTFSGQGQSPNRKKYYIKIDEKKGKRSYKGSSINEFEYKYPQFKCDSKYGYKFDRWECFENKPYDNYDGYYEAIFKGLWYRKVPKLAWIFVITAIVASTVFLLVNSDGSDSNSNIVNAEINNKVNSYIEGIELNLDTLKEYKRKYCDSSTIIQSDVKEKSLWQKIWIFGSDDNSNSTNESSVIPNFCSKIDNAIAIRTAINLGKIDELKGQMFSESQQDFKNSIDSIEDKYKKQIGDILYVRKVSVMDLNQVAELILKTQRDLREKEKIKQKEIELEKIRNQDKQNEQKIKDQQKNNTQNQQNSQTQNQQSNSNSLENEFWDLVHSGNAQKESYSNLLEKHKNKGGDIIAFLNKICKNSASFKKFKDIPEIDRKSAKKLTEIDKN
jgi:hypothetical protein